MGTECPFCFGIIVLAVMTFLSHFFPVVQGKSLTSESLCPARGFYRDKMDCSKFYRCVEISLDGSNRVDLEKHEFVCPPGTLFDDKLYVCNYPDRVTQEPGQCNGNPGTYGQYHTWYYHYPGSVYFLPIIHHPFYLTPTNLPLTTHFV